MTRCSSPNRREERFDTDDVHHAREVVGEHVQRHLSRHFGQRLHQKVRRPHPHLQRAERMLDCLATSTHRVRILVQPRLHSIDNILVLPPLDATLRSLRALSLQRASAARVGPVVVQDQSIFLVREVVGELLTGRTNVDVLLSHVAEILLAEAAFRLRLRCLGFWQRDRDASLIACEDLLAFEVAVATVLIDLGFEPLDAGDITKSRLLEPFGMVWINQALLRGKGRTWAFAAVERK